jgi:hypothetical protein
MFGSIDPGPGLAYMKVRYEGGVEGTRFGLVMFQADEVLKQLMAGRNNYNNQPIVCTVPGYKPLVQMEAEDTSGSSSLSFSHLLCLTLRVFVGVHCSAGSLSTRMWFTVKECHLVQTADGATMVVDRISMQLNYETKRGNDVIADPVAAAFAKHITDNFELYAANFPILFDLLKLGEIVGVFNWMKAEQIPIDLSFMANYRIQPVQTPTTTPANTVTVDGTPCLVFENLHSFIFLLLRFLSQVFVVFNRLAGFCTLPTTPSPLNQLSTQLWKLFIAICKLRVPVTLSLTGPSVLCLLQNRFLPRINIAIASSLGCVLVISPKHSLLFRNPWPALAKTGLSSSAKRICLMARNLLT